MTSDIQGACDVLADVYRKTDGRDGYVSVEVTPTLAHDTDATVAEAREWVKRVDRANLLVKVPATKAGLEGLQRPGCRQPLEGIERYIASGGNPAKVASVASFFVSRMDVEVDRRLSEIGTDAASALAGTTAIANTRLAYQAFLETFSGERWQRLVASGARIQRPLWASTSVKNPSYPDTLYVQELIAPHTVNTMPLETIDAFQNHGPRPRPFGPEQIAAAHATIRAMGDKSGRESIQHGHAVSTVI